MYAFPKAYIWFLIRTFKWTVLETVHILSLKLRLSKARVQTEPLASRRPLQLALPDLDRYHCRWLVLCDPTLFHIGSLRERVLQQASIVKVIFRWFL
jgi:hypothetical protein